MSEDWCTLYGRCVDGNLGRLGNTLPQAAVEAACFSQYILPNQSTSPPEDEPPAPPPDIPPPPSPPLNPPQFPPTDYGNGCAPRKHPILRRHARKNLFDYLGICTLV